MIDKTDKPFEDTRKSTFLYHYTTMKCAVSILKSRTLRFGEIVRLNDLNESQRLIFYSNMNGCDKGRDVLNSYEQISLTCDDLEEDFTPKRGFDLLTMWGHYAEGGHGVCLVLNKKRLLEKCKRLSACFQNHVEYTSGYNSIIRFTSDNPEEELDRRTNEVYFTKSEEWRQEQEFRIIQKRCCGPNSIDISDCIEGIILTEVSTELDGYKKCERLRRRRHIKQLYKLCCELPIYRYCHCNLSGARILFTDQDRQTFWSSEDEGNSFTVVRLDTSFLDDKSNNPL